MARHFVTILPHGENLELVKDTGQIPYHFHKTLGYRSTLVTYYYTRTGGRQQGPVPFPPKQQEQIIEDYPNWMSEVPGMEIAFLPYQGRGKFYEKAIFQYLKKNSKKIDVLNLFHFNSENVFYTLFYKFLNPTGKVYLKLDLDIHFLSAQKSIFNTSGIFGRLKNILYSNVVLYLFFKKVTLISAESDVALSYFKTRFSRFSFKLLLAPNGIDTERAMELTEGILPFDSKENILLTVGRIGTGQKNNELMLQTIATLPESNWKFYFAGPVTEAFKNYYEQLSKKYPSLGSKVVFTGNIQNRAELLKLYNRARIFWLTSRFEGFPISAVEAMTYGNILMLHENIHAANTLTNNAENGMIFDDDNLHGKLTALLNDPVLQERLSKKTVDYAQKEFSWQHLVKKIDTQLA